MTHHGDDDLERTLQPRTFKLIRRTDRTGLSGTGHVLDGCVFGDGTVVIRWRGDTPCTTIHQDMQSFERIHVHGHPDDNEVVWTERNR